MPSPPVDNAPARVLALMVAAKGKMGEPELRVLDGLPAFHRLGMTRGRFVELSQSTFADIGLALREHAWLRDQDVQYVDALLDAVPDTATRLLVCRLSEAVMRADGHVTEPERLVYEHMLAHWQISPAMVSLARLTDRDS
jgi:KaiC/GvpD/RAD55 family RecA-like ATPase